MSPLLLLLLPLASAFSLKAVKEEFEAFKAKFRPLGYANAEEENFRFGVFTKSFERIQELNELNGQKAFGINAMADRTQAERFQRGRKGYGDKDSKGAQTHSPELSSLPDSKDWRIEDPIPVTPVKNQGQCGSCWAFSTIETVESGYIMAGGRPQLFSPQQVASCVESVDGCGGGDTVTAFKYLSGVVGLSSAWYWPYLQGMTPLNSCTDKACTKACDKNLTELATEETFIGPYGQVTGFEYATDPCYESCNKQNLTKLAASLVEKVPFPSASTPACGTATRARVSSHPKPVARLATMILTTACSLSGMFNASAPTPYWIVRNSWATSWGIEGYIHLEMTENTCGLADEATLAKLKGV
eukprot:jgi/Bigna1/89829/estExt_fgenesh1_pg.C_560070